MLRPVYLPILTTLLFSTLVLANGAEYLSKNNVLTFARTRKSMMGGSPTFLSPSVSSNKEQKDQMAHLNNRMAAYVEKVFNEIT